MCNPSNSKVLLSSIFGRRLTNSFAIFKNMDVGLCVPTPRDPDATNRVFWDVISHMCSYILTLCSMVGLYDDLTPCNEDV
jgi:hypothetical protein